MQSWFLLGMIASVLLAVSLVLNKRLLSRFDPTLFSVLFQFLIGVYALFYIYFTGGRLENYLQLLIAFVVSGLVYGIGSAIFFIGLKKVEVSKASLINSSRILWSSLFGILLFQEVVNIHKVAGILLILSGLVVVYFKRSHLRFTRHDYLIILSAFFYGVASIVDKFFVTKMPILAYMFVNFLGSSFFCLATKPRLIRDVMKVKPRLTDLLLLMTSSGIMFGSAAALFTAYDMGGEVSIIMPVYQFSIVIVILLSYFFLRERDDLLKKVIGSFTAIAGIVLLSI